MAQPVPHRDVRVPPGTSRGRSELDTLRALCDELPEGYRIFHQCHWSRDNHRYVDIGEIDFVVVNGAGEVLFIEQKNGPLQETAGLTKAYARGKEKNVAGQIHRSLDLVQKKFNDRHPGLALGPTYLICCPDHQVTNLNSVGLERRHIADAAEYPHLARKVLDLLPEPAQPEDARFRTVMDFFSDVCHLVPDIHAQLESQEAYCLSHRGTLADFLLQLEMQPFRLRVQGIAGCGKSLLAAAVYAERVRRGERVLLVCFNRSLAERMRSRLRPGGHVNTFHGFCTEFLKARNEVVDFARAGDPGFWTGLLERVTAQEIPPAAQFDIIIVDEGQDFEPEWHQMLRLFLAPGASQFWFEDPHQNLYDKPPVPLKDFVTYHCRENFRSPRSLADHIRDTVGIDFIAANPNPGMGAREHTYSTPEEQVAHIEGIVRRLRKEGFRDEEIAILTCQGAKSTAFFGLDRVGAVTLKRFTGTYDAQGNQLFSDGDIAFDTVYRFKGNEAPAVILVEDGEKDMAAEKRQRLLFCGMTRATLSLDVVRKAATN